jgi:hypothetical protein
LSSFHHNVLRLMPRLNHNIIEYLNLGELRPLIAMTEKTSVPKVLGAFLQDGTEAAQCRSYRKKFDSNHIVIQI